MRRCSLAVLLLGLLAAASALRVTVTRRQALSAASAASAASACSALPVSAKGNALADEELRLLIVKAKELRSAVRTGAAARRKLPMDPTPGVNNYVPLTSKIERGTTTVLLPLQAKLSAVAAAAPLADEELKKALVQQPMLLTGHLSELKYYLGKHAFEPYTSKTTGKTYPGGKVERELEEVEETCDDFLTLLSGKKPAPGEDD